MKPDLVVGRVLHISRSSGNLIVEAEGKEVRIGEAVFDRGGRRVGSVFDIFGPVDSPFMSVKTRLKDPERLVGKELFRGQKER